MNAPFDSVPCCAPHMDRFGYEAADVLDTLSALRRTSLDLDAPATAWKLASVCGCHWLDAAAFLREEASLTAVMRARLREWARQDA